MATASAREPVKDHPLVVTALLSVVGYVLVLGSFAGVVDFWPTLDRTTVVLFADLIAVVNTLALTALLVGYVFIRRSDVRRHRAAMLTAFSLILVFLVLYLWKVGGGFEKSFVGPQSVTYAYLAMLAIHIVLSVVAVPVVLYPVVLGLTHTPAELEETAHARVGRIAVASWSLSLFLGVVTYVLLNHVYSWVPR